MCFWIYIGELYRKNRLWLTALDNDSLWSCSYQWVKFDACKPGDGQPPQGLLESEAAISFDAFQRQTFDEDATDPMLQGIF